MSLKSKPIKKTETPHETTFFTDEYRDKVRISSYIGKKGYTIPKNSLDTLDLEFLYKDLYMIPNRGGGPAFGAQDLDAFPVYRENSNKIYLPRFYGIERYGRPPRDEICTESSKVVTISTPFVKQLRDYQIDVIEQYLTAVDNGNCKETRGGILQLGCGQGKCLAYNTPILMYDGTIKMVQDVIVGDQLMGDDSTPRNVLSLARGIDEMYEVREQDLGRDTGRKYIVNSEHILSLKMYREAANSMNANYDYDEKDDTVIIDISVKDYLMKPKILINQMMGFRTEFAPSHLPKHYEIDVRYSYRGDYYGFEIDGNRRFVLGDFTVTHNTVLSINILSRLSKKTLIIVHKEFLLNQWIERIEEFCPNATIGRIQGSVFDIEGKDIVIAMLQTVYDRDFPENAFDSFGITIVDEVHRIGSCQFSRALLRIQTPMMLGITATLERKDGLTKVIHHFIGPLIYHQASQNPSNKNEFEHVLVRGMEFVSRDTDFQEVSYDFRGNVLYSTMISKLCAFGPRTRFLVQILRDLINENPDAQILVLGHNRSLLVNLNDAIIDQEIATVGYYLGGMKQCELDRSTEKQILLATYAMASEGFDHKNLSILVMITPKTDIVQSVGRIFRTKHERPIIIDVIDQHDIFKNQWRKRLTFYRKSGYKIETIQSTEYHGFGNPDTKWTPVRAVKHKETGHHQPHPIEEIQGKCFIQIDSNITDDMS